MGSPKSSYGLRSGSGVLVIALAGWLAACSQPVQERPLAEAPADDTLPVGDNGGIEKVGTPYKVAGTWYYPKQEPAYDFAGMASWYGPQFHGRATANGETFNMNALTAAHRTLPMPSFVKVTNLENGRSLVLRVNDRGPFVDDRLIDVSRRAAQLLGFADKGLTRVRVQASDQRGRVASKRSLEQVLIASGLKEPKPEIPETRVAANKAQAAEVSSVQPRMMRMSPVATESGVADSGGGAEKGQGNKADGAARAAISGFFVQLGAYSQLQNAETQQRKAQASGLGAKVQEKQRGEQTLFVVRMGPFENREKADRWLDQVVKQGFYGARVLTASPYPPV